ncbi:unnamed protein product [Schistosoma margrebowiei]|uniref:Uncharacterized protein n=1 Tax=Schistosoma margrebowiei TaxID=48269 RepID=A0A183LEP1_9TREM|nr:unnamed protein product [Schistosoma margrebowiei]
MASVTVTNLHVKCRNSPYPRTSDIQRYPVPDDKVSWNLSWPEYHPVAYTAPGISKKPWADPDNQLTIQFNKIDGILDRTSFMGQYKFSADGLPLNPCGRTGITGRGVLGRWGPNHAADPIVTRLEFGRRQRVNTPARTIINDFEPSFKVSNDQSLSSRGFQPGSLHIPTWLSPVVSDFMDLCHVWVWPPLAFFQLTPTP